MVSLHILMLVISIYSEIRRFYQCTSTIVFFYPRRYYSILIVTVLERAIKRLMETGSVEERRARNWAYEMKLACKKVMKREVVSYVLLQKLAEELGKVRNAQPPCRLILSRVVPCRLILSRIVSGCVSQKIYFDNFGYFVYTSTSGLVPICRQMYDFIL